MMKKAKNTVRKASPKAAPKKIAVKAAASPKAFEAKINELKDWRGETLRAVRAMIRKAVPGVVEELKWRGVPVWSQDGILCTGETYKEVVKLTFPKGAKIKDPKNIFNSSLEGNARRAIDIREGQKLDAKAFTALIKEAIAVNIKK